MLDPPQLRHRLVRFIALEAFETVHKEWTHVPRVECIATIRSKDVPVPFHGASELVLGLLGLLGWERGVTEDATDGDDLGVEGGGADSAQRND